MTGLRKKTHKTGKNDRGPNISPDADTPENVIPIHSRRTAEQQNDVTNASWKGTESTGGSTDYLFSQQLGRTRRVQRDLLLEDVSGDDEIGEDYCEECLRKQSWWEESGVHALQGAYKQPTPFQIGRLFNMRYDWLAVVVLVLVILITLKVFGVV